LEDICFATAFCRSFLLIQRYHSFRLAIDLFQGQRRIKKQNNGNESWQS